MAQIKQEINGQYLQRWCVCIRTGRNTKWGIYHDFQAGTHTLTPLIFGTKRQATEKARELSHSEERKHHHWLYRAGRIFYSGEVLL
jgi:hypothetical protein